MNEKGILNTGTAVSLFKDGRIVSQCAPQVAVLKVSDPLETVDPIPNKVYTSYKDNLISQWRNDRGGTWDTKCLRSGIRRKQGRVHLDVTQKADA
jgi:hypothetical protein